MKRLLILALLISCGDIENKSGGEATVRLGSALTPNTSLKLSQVEVSYLKKICDSMEVKDNTVNVVHSGKAWLTAGTYLDDCAKTFRPVAPPTPVTELILTGTAANKSFILNTNPDPMNTGGPDYFLDYQSHQQGLLASVCSQVKNSNDINKVVEENSTVLLEFRFFTGEEACDVDPNRVCAQIDYAIKNQANQYVREYIHHFEVDTNPAGNTSNRGFLIERDLYQKCVAGVDDEGKSVYSYTKKSQSFNGFR
jgi:hypothetical protein